MIKVNLDILNQRQTPALYSDTLANRPAPSFNGRLFISTDTGQIFQDNGVSWILIADAGAGGGSLQTVTTNGNTTDRGINITANNLVVGSGTLNSTLSNAYLNFIAPTQNLQLQVSGSGGGSIYTTLQNRSGVIALQSDNVSEFSNDAGYIKGVNISTGLTNTSGTITANIATGVTGGQTIYGGTASTDRLYIYNYTGASIGYVFGLGGMAAGSGATPTSGTLFRASNNYTDVSGNVFDFQAVSTVSQTLTSYSGTLRGFVSNVGIGAANTQNWSSALGVVGGVFAVSISSGAIGTIAGVKSVYITLANNSATATLSNAVGLNINSFTATGTISNSTYILTGTGANIYGNWNIYSSTSYNNYLGTGATLINTTTDNGVDKLQVNGSATFASGIATNGYTASSSYAALFNGNVGINNTNPLYTLDVTGTTHLSGNSLIGGTLGVGAITSLQTGSGELDLVLQRTGGTASAWSMYLPSGSTDIRWYYGSDRMTLTSGGAALINTTTDIGGNFKLQVNGAIKCNGFSGGGLQVTTSQTLSDNYFYFTYNGSGGNTLTLPTALTDNRQVWIKNFTAFPVTIAAPTGGGILVNGIATPQATITLGTYASVMFSSDGGTNKYIQWL